MTNNQRVVLCWLRENCSAVGIIRVSNSEIAEIFGWSQQYTQKILSNLVKAGYLEERQKGMGHRATKYRVSSHNQSASSHNQGADAQHVQKSRQKRVAPFRYINTPRKHKDSAQTIAHIRNVFDRVAVDVYKPVKTTSSPFKRFQERWDKVEKWRGPDFVCYFSHVYRVRFGDTPTLEWPKNLGAARLLLKRVGDPIALKAFIQVAFYKCKRPPDGLYSFSYGRTYQDVKDILASDVPEEVLDEYDDEYVYPWLRQELRRRSHEAQLEYDRMLVQRGLGIYN